MYMNLKSNVLDGLDVQLVVGGGEKKNDFI